jgi:hypothetical protein
MDFVAPTVELKLEDDRQPHKTKTTNNPAAILME